MGYRPSQVGTQYGPDVHLPDPPRALGPYGFQITTHGDGYRVGTDGHRVDVAEFGVLANRALLTPNPAQRVRLLGQALDLWRGRTRGGAGAAVVAAVSTDPAGGASTELAASRK